MLPSMQAYKIHDALDSALDNDNKRYTNIKDAIYNITFMWMKLVQ